MRNFGWLLITLASLSMACVGDDEQLVPDAGQVDAPVTPDAAPPADAPTGEADAAAGLAVVVEWTHSTVCSAATGGSVSVNTTVTGATGNVTYSGTLSGCNAGDGAFDEASESFTCPGSSPKAGTMTVTDESGEVTIEFTITHCENGREPPA